MEVFPGFAGARLVYDAGGGVHGVQVGRACRGVSGRRSSVGLPASVASIGCLNWDGGGG